jgi:hypothetical protein
MRRKPAAVVDVSLFRTLHFDREPTYTLHVIRGGNWNPRHYYLSGVARALCEAWFYDKCPVGVLLDRLQEEPEEAQGHRSYEPLHQQDVTDAVQWLRENRPDWV